MSSTAQARSSTADVEYSWRPQRGPQKALIDCPYPEILFGGARGGGKTDGILGKYALKEKRWGPHFNAVFFRKEMPQQDDLIERAKQIYLPTGARYSEQKKQFAMPHGGRIRFRPMESIADAEKYQGQSLSDAAVEEAGNYPMSAPIDRLFGCLRSAHGVPVQLLLSANPGGPGHHWIKQRFIDPAPLGYKRLVRELPNGKEHHAVYIPSRIQDNAVLLAKDPDYVSRLYLVGSVELVRAWLEGDWNVIAGAFFPEFSLERHVCAPFAIPEHWSRIRMGDWGSARPFAILWGAISDGSTQFLPDRRPVPRGTLVIYREWYGWNGKANEGCHLTAQEVGQGIKEREAGEKIADEVLDPAAFARDGGPSIAERMNLGWRRADNSRVAKIGAIGGWDEVRQRLKATGIEGGQGLHIFSTCSHLIRTLPALQHDPLKAEDVDTNGEDHAPDALRYGCMSRPVVRDKPASQPRRFEQDLTFNELLQRQTAKRRASE